MRRVNAHFPNINVDELIDELVKKQAEEPARPKVTIEELIRRKTSHVRVDGKIYRVEVTEVPLAK